MPFSSTLSSVIPHESLILTVRRYAARKVLFSFRGAVPPHHETKIKFCEALKALLHQTKIKFCEAPEALKSPAD
jgi:hypothetical protein